MTTPNPPFRLSTASLSGVVRCWHIATLIFRYFLRYFSSTNRTDLNSADGRSQIVKSNESPNGTLRQPIPFPWKSRLAQVESIASDRSPFAVACIYQAGLWSAIFFAIFFQFHRTNLRIPPDLSPVSLRLALLFLLLGDVAPSLRERFDCVAANDAERVPLS